METPEEKRARRPATWAALATLVALVLIAWVVNATGIWESDWQYVLFLPAFFAALPIYIGFEKFFRRYFP